MQHTPTVHVIPLVGVQHTNVHHVQHTNVHHVQHTNVHQCAAHHVLPKCTRCKNTPTVQMLKCSNVVSKCTNTPFARPSTSLDLS